MSGITEDALTLLLSSQYVLSDHLPNRAWRVLKGSGMGLKHSGETADAALYTVAERERAGDHNIQVQHEIVGFARFRDDVFVVGRNRSLLHKSIRQYFERARYFKMICESGSSHSAKFLEVTVSRKGSQLCAIPTWKPTALGVPLAEDSAHPKHVHESWPTAVVMRLIHISTHLKDANKSS